MEQKIKITYGDGILACDETLNKLEIAQKILELLETEEVEEVTVVYKKREPATTADSKN